jgi:predicted amidohydrolase YtcJ
MRILITLLISTVILLCSSCYKGEEVDLIVHNARIHCMDDANTVAEAMAIKDGKIVEVGPERQILNKYRSDEILDAGQRDIYPGFTDAHGHLMEYAKQKLGIDLTGATSWESVIRQLMKHPRNEAFVLARGWDNTLWENAQLPDNAELNRLFPNIPAALYRVDGHAVLVNDFLLQKAGISSKTKVQGGKVELKDSKCTGILLDNAMGLIENYLGDFKASSYKQKLVGIQEELLSLGITGVHEAGITDTQFDILRQMNQAGTLKIQVYAMLAANDANYALAKKMGIWDKGNLVVRSFKLYLDGALGSRGALLKNNYSDAPTENGLLLTSRENYKKWIQRSLDLNYQLNVHAIGDSANALALHSMADVFLENPDHRWRIEHAQVVDPKDLPLFMEYAVIPSVQPTHATTDCRWALVRLGAARMKGAYAYRSLYEQLGMIVLGTDFPVESIDPFATIRSAVLRTNAESKPKKGFNISEALSLDLVLRGMTIWPQVASFQESKKGKLTEGMEATFFIAAKPISLQTLNTRNYAWKTFVKGSCVMNAE